MGKIEIYFMILETKMGFLLTYFVRKACILRILPTDLVAQFLRKFRWPNGRNLVGDIQLLRDTMLGSMGEDCDRVEWFRTYQHKSGNMWSALREVPNKVWWWKLVWYNRKISKFSFTNWLLCLGRLSTRDRLCSWGMLDTDRCYCQEKESNHHLFFECQYSTAM
ncbi:hypothetical protein LIER_40013 [Lithospermum erythrorhizon]|uniref:Reverse transcriptase zinc-binding domain-containing protein n=1 Tax=Lithospermum erythrorhizon TaxID=34254 RepID=A0AAV3QNF2_LITER